MHVIYSSPKIIKIVGRHPIVRRDCNDFENRIQNTPLILLKSAHHPLIRSQMGTYAEVEHIRANQLQNPVFAFTQMLFS